jgi:hypothetical protein
MFAFMKNSAFSFFFLVFSSGVFGQSLSFNQFDTIKSTHRTFGSLDTLSNSVKPFQSIFYLSPESTLLSPLALYAHHGSMLSFLTIKDNQTRFSALPHLGFMYGFGAQGAQRLHVDFQQSYRHGLLMNVSFDKNKGNGFLRNDAFSLNNFIFQLLRNGTHYSFDLNANSQSQARSWSNGLLSSSAIPDIDLNLQAVQKENAQSSHVLNAIRYSHQWDLNKDSIRGFGIIAKHAFNESRRTYSEIDSLVQLYNHVYWNADSTSDRLKERTFSNQAGVFFQQSKWSVQSLMNLRKRTWGDAYSARNVNELWWMNQLRYAGKSFELNHVSGLNLSGAAQGFTSLSKILWQMGKSQFSAQHDLRNELPELMQRKYYSNNVQYDLTSLSKQWNQSLGIQLLRQVGKIELSAQYRFLQFRNVYVFDGVMGTWVNNATASTGFAQQGKVGVKWNYKGLQIHPSYTWTDVNHSLNFQSAHNFNVHVQWKGGVFKAKKLHMLFAGDVQYLSAFQQMTFVPQMGVFDLVHNPGTLQKGYVNASFTTAIEVETFRFFIRIDNIGAYWVDPSISLLQNYPFPRMQAKIGLTWDFWN